MGTGVIMHFACLLHSLVKTRERRNCAPQEDSEERWMAVKTEAFSNPGDALQAYVRAFARKDIGAIMELFSNGGLVEIPMLKPNRLFGQTELRRGHEAIFEAVSSSRFELSEPAVNDIVAIASGRLKTERGGVQHVHPVAIVAEVDSERLMRLSLYMDGRNQRLWSDKAIL
ncbi:nuclear transport factor 2 family protein [Mesorhizobium sp. B3-1-7]|uniref:nuclear transport factor 2 family protein n=1 Tax=Mesorhizobium sp. B3-1-7 TaxID=2589894 RepID=UPI0015E49746|nr:nuclear transport factor 2 family protein [Mesorhizobium sp. B3-1-7]